MKKISSIDLSSEFKYKLVGDPVGGWPQWPLNVDTEIPHPLSEKKVKRVLTNDPWNKPSTEGGKTDEERLIRMVVWPSEFCIHLCHDNLLPHQPNILDDTKSRDLLIAAGRRGSKSFISSRKGLHLAWRCHALGIQDEVPVILVSSAERQAKILLREVAKPFKRRGNEELRKCLLKPPSTECITFDTGMKMYSLPAGDNADKIRGDTALALIYDEAGYIPDAVFDAVDPMTDTVPGYPNPGHRIRISTFNAKTPQEGRFYNDFISIVPKSLIDSANEDNLYSWTGRYTFAQFEKQREEERNNQEAYEKMMGMESSDEAKYYVERERVVWWFPSHINLVHFKGLMPNVKLYEWRRKTTSVYLTEHVCVPAGKGNRYFEPEEIDQCINRNPEYKPIKYASEEMECEAGYDPARVSDPSVFVIVERYINEEAKASARVVAVYEWVNRSWQFQYKSIEKLIADFNIKKVYIDETQKTGITEWLTETTSCKVEGLPFNSKKEQIFKNAKLIMGQRRAVMPGHWGDASEKLISQLRSVYSDRRVSSRGVVSDVPMSPKGKHDDHCDAFVLSLWGLKIAKMPFRIAKIPKLMTPRLS